MAIGIGKLLFKIIAAIKKNKLIKGNNYDLEETPCGVRIVFDSIIQNEDTEGGFSNLSVLAKLKAATSDYQTYTGDIYIGGLNTTPVETDTEIKIRKISESEVIPYLDADWAVYEVRKEYWPVTPEGGGDAVPAAFWTCQPPIIPGELETGE